jgi:hypothetical protein
LQDCFMILSSLDNGALYLTISETRSPLEFGFFTSND